jgi:hypothetical protein
MVAAIDRELNARKLGIALTPEERLEAFGSTRLAINRLARPRLCQQRWPASGLANRPPRCDRLGWP